jgi:hypothetical protein
MIFYILIFVLILIIFNFNNYESFNDLNFDEIKNSIKKNFKPLPYVDKNSLQEVKEYVSKILKDFNINNSNYFLKSYDLNKRYSLEVSIIIDDILNKFLEIIIIITNGKIEIQDVIFKNNDEILLDGYDNKLDHNFLIPQDFSWRENPVFQNIVVPDENQNVKLSGDNLNQLNKLFKVKNQIDISKALNMAQNTIDNRKNFYERGFCFGTNIIGINNQKDCEENFGTWDKICTKNVDCKFYKEERDGRGGRGGCIDPGYCEFPRGVERIGYTKEKKREMDRINRLKLGSNYTIFDQIEFDIPSCYCEDPTNISPDCCDNKDYVF